jgi:hypothetical protein
VKKASGSDWTFVGLKRVNNAIQDSPTLSTELNGMSPADRYDQLKQINKSGLRNAAARGTNVHHMFERGLRGETHLTDPMDGDAGSEYEPAVQAFLDAYQPELIAAELVCINRSMNAPANPTRFSGGYGGTADAIVKIDGKTLLVDWKSRGVDSDHGSYPEEAAQLGAYASADYYIAEGKAGPVRMPVPHLDGGIIVSVKPDGCRVYPIDLDAAAEHWQALHRWWVARLAEKRALGRPWAPRVARSAPDPRAEDAPSIKRKVPKVEDGVAYLPQASNTDADTGREAATFKATAEWREKRALDDAKMFPPHPEVTAAKAGFDSLGNLLNADLDTLIADAVDVSTLNAIWAINQRKWQDPHHTRLAAARKAWLLGNQ